MPGRADRFREIWNETVLRPARMDQVFRLKVTLRYCTPAIWRQVDVPGWATLWDLHRVIQAAFLWEDAHLHQFLGNRSATGLRGREQPAPIKNEKRVLLGETLCKEGDTLIYEYDFGDDWLHEIRVENTFPPEPGVRYPRCTAAQRSAPPEDSGGPPGYEDLLAALTGPSHERHEEAVEWLGPEFDPEDPNMRAVEKEMRRIRVTGS